MWIVNSQHTLYLQVDKKTHKFTSPPPELDLVPLEVGLVLHHFYESLKNTGEIS